jgi:hypothetical protein
MSETELLRHMGNPSYIEPEDLNDVRKGGCRWTWVMADPTPKGDQPDGKYRQVDVLVGTDRRVVEVVPKNVSCAMKR